MKIYVFGLRGIPNIQGGVEKHCEYLYALFPSEYEITVFRRHSYVNRKEGFESIKFIDLPSTRIKGIETFLHSFLCTIVCILKRPDIIHIHNIGPGLFTPLLKLFGLKIIITYHSPNYEHAKWGFMAKKILLLGEYLSLRYANYIIFVNKNQRAKFGINIKNKSINIPNGVLIPEKSIHTDYINSLGLKPYKYILAVGRITQEKGFDYLIESYGNIRCADYKLVIAGGIDHVTAFSKQIIKKTKEKGIILSGFVTGEDLNQLYSFARLFVLPSYNEGLPLALLEAMSYRLPVVASDIPANLAVGLPPQCYFPVGNEQALTARLDKVMKEEFVPVNYDMRKYDWNHIAEQVIKVYEQIISLQPKNSR
jgi:glycosyltransferase involved in cell wall biosynthesis